MTLVETAASVMSRAQQGEAEDALADAQRALLTVGSATLHEQAAIWYAIAAAELVRGSVVGGRTAADRCLSLAVEADDPGWASAALSVRAMALSRQGRMEPALLDLARSEAELLRCTDDGLRNWSHTGLGYCYLELRLYELAQPHFEQALELPASPMPLTESPVIDLMNLVELHLRWADELERAKPYGGAEHDVDAHRRTAHQYAVRGVAQAETLAPPALLAGCRAMELVTRTRSSAERSLDELRAAFGSDDRADHMGSRAVVGGALARALWALGRRSAAVEVAREAAAVAESAQDWQVGASAQWLLVEMEAQSGVPGAAAGRSYAEMLSRVLWQQRLSTLHGAQAALQIERLNRDKEIAQQAASEDPLTGIGNRRALDDTLRALQVDADGATSEARGFTDTLLSMLVVDLDDFKKINDTYGHVVGDEVLCAVAMAMRGVARTDDVVARLGGDEFVVLARGADAAAGRHLAERLSSAIDALAVGTRDGQIHLSASVGVATASAGDDAAVLLAKADAAMYAVKEDRRIGRQRSPHPVETTVKARL